MPSVIGSERTRRARLGLDVETAVTLISPVADIILVIDA